MALLCLLAAGCSGASETASTTLAVPDRANANVSVAADGAFVALVWSASATGGATDIYTAVSDDGGATFSSPSRVNTTPGDARVNGEQPPRVALVPRPSNAPEIAVIWTAKGESGTALQTARSADWGKTFSRAALVTGTDAPGNRGWEAIQADGHGILHAVWLDHRQLAQRESNVAATHRHAAGHTTTTDGVAMAQLSQLYFDTLDPAPELKLGPTGALDPQPLTGGVCYCCKTAMAAGAGGEIYLAWRHVYPGNLRDIAFTVSRDGGTFAEPVRVSEDQWALEGCPDDGPAMAVDDRGRVHIVWPTVVTDEGAPRKVLFHASSADGRTFTERTRATQA